MKLLILGGVLAIASLVIGYFPTDRATWRKIVLALGIAGATLAFIQGYRNQERAADLQKQLTALSEKNRPRALSPAQQERITTQMRQFAGAQYDVSVPEGDPEAAGLLPLIEKSLDDAGWKEVVCAFGTLVINRDNKPPVCVRPPGTKDVTVAFAPERASRLAHIASALASALTAEGISASFGSGNVSYQTDAIHILIGRKT
jgi:hypothetical protein